MSSQYIRETSLILLGHISDVYFVSPFFSFFGLIYKCHLVLPLLIVDYTSVDFPLR